MTPGALKNDEFRRIVREMCGERTDAAEWFLSCVDLSNVWDHIADGDDLDKDYAHKVLAFVTCGWGTLPFYIENSRTLAAVALNVVTAWKSSDISRDLRAHAFDVYTELGTTVAFLVGGMDHATRWSSVLRAWAFKSMMEDNERDSHGTL